MRATKTSVAARRVSLVVSLLLVCVLSRARSMVRLCAQDSMPAHVQEFLDTYLPLAQSQYQMYGVPVSVALAQSAIETSWGRSTSMVEHNNFFAITSSATSPRAIGTYAQEVGGHTYTYSEYATAEDAWLDLGYFLTHDPNYAFAQPHLDDPRTFYAEIYCMYTQGVQTGCDTATPMQIWDDWTWRYDALFPPRQPPSMATPLLSSDAVMRRAAESAPQFRPYNADEGKDCWKYVKHVWLPWFDLSKYDGVSPSSDWAAIESPDDLLPGDVLSTHQGHQWGMGWHGGIYAGTGRGEHWQWDCTSDKTGSGAYKRELLYYPGQAVLDFEYYHVGIHRLLSGQFDARPIQQPAPLSLKPGEEVEIAFDIQNTGDIAWSPAYGIELAHVNGEQLGAATPQVLLGEIAPGQVARWVLPIAAPQAPGVYRSVWQMVHQGDPFGPKVSVLAIVSPGDLDGSGWDLGVLIQGWLEDFVQAFFGGLIELWEDVKQQLLERLNLELDRLWQEFLAWLERQIGDLWQDLMQQCCGTSVIPPAAVLLGTLGLARRRHGGRRGIRGQKHEP